MPTSNILLEQNFNATDVDIMGLEGDKETWSDFCI